MLLVKMYLFSGGVNMLENITAGLNSLEKLIYIINGKRYVLSNIYSLDKKGKAEDLLNRAERHFDEIQEIIKNFPLRNEEQEIHLYKCFRKIRLCLQDWNTTTEETTEIISKFNNDELQQLNEQIKIYLSIRELHRKFS